MATCALGFFAHSGAGKMRSFSPTASAAFPGAKIDFEPGTNFLRPVDPVATSYLTTDDGQPGLKAEFFSTADFLGAPVLTRIDPNVDYDFDRKADVQLDGGVLAIELRESDEHVLMTGPAALAYRGEIDFGALAG